MGLPGKCWYPLAAFKTGGAPALAAMLEDFFRGGWDPIVMGGVDGNNLSDTVAGGGLALVGSGGGGTGSGGVGGGAYPPKPSPPPHLPPPWGKKLVVELADETADARIQKKGAPGTPERRKPGLELVIDPTDTTYGKVCFVAKQDKTKQIGSVTLENPVTVTNPKISFLANHGKMVVGTSGAHALELVRNGSTVTVEERTGSAAITHDIRTVKFSNGTALRTLNTASFTLENLADILYTLAYDNKTTGTISGWTATASATYTLDITSFTSNTLAALLATVINDIQTNGFLSVSLYRCTTPRARYALDCDLFTLNQLGQATCAFLAELGVSGLETAISGLTAAYQPLDSDLTSISAIATTSTGRTILTTPAIAVDNNFPRWDGTTGVLQASGITDDDTKIKTARATLEGPDSSAFALKSTNNQAITVNAGEATNGAYGGAATFRGGDASTDDGNGGAATLRGGNAWAGGAGGALTLKAGMSPDGLHGVLDIQEGDGASRIKLNADGTVTQAGDHTFSGKLIVTGTAKTDSFQMTVKPRTITTTTYQINEEDSIVTGDCSGLGAADVGKLTLPSAVTYPGKIVIIKITAAGAGGALLRVAASAGNVEGAASHDSDASTLTKLTYASDGTNWWSV